jgi:predicted GIY-YIG superfamily endonuclease
MTIDHEQKRPSWWVYLVRCADGTLYTGIAKDVQARVDDHNRGLGAKYTRGRTPVELVYREWMASRSAALRREHAIKRLSRIQKCRMIARYQGQRTLAEPSS